MDPLYYIIPSGSNLEWLIKTNKEVISGNGSRSKKNKCEDKFTELITGYLEMVLRFD